MASLEELKKRKMEQYLQDSTNTQNMQEQQMVRATSQIDEYARKIMSVEAWHRITNIKTVKPDFALQVEMFLVQMYQSGQLSVPVDENTLITILDKLTTKKETKITRR